MSPPWGAETGALFKTAHCNLWQDADISRSGGWGSGGVEAATHPLLNQNSLGRACRLAQRQKTRGKKVWWKAKSVWLVVYVVSYALYNNGMEEFLFYTNTDQT